MTEEVIEDTAETKYTLEFADLNKRDGFLGVIAKNDIFNVFETITTQNTVQITVPRLMSKHFERMRSRAFFEEFKNHRVPMVTTSEYID